MLFIFDRNEKLELTVLSMAKFESEEETPQALSAILLKRNAEMETGRWCIILAGQMHIYACMHNTEIRQIDSNYVGHIGNALIDECDEFDRRYLKVMNQ